MVEEHSERTLIAMFFNHCANLSPAHDTPYRNKKPLLPLPLCDAAKIRTQKAAQLRDQVKEIRKKEFLFS